MDIKEEQEFLLRVGDEKFTLPYREAIERVNKKLETINKTYSEKLGRTFISSQSSRIKTPESCLKKMIHKGYDIKEKEAQSRLNDIAGIRVICSFLDDIYRLSNLLKEEEDIEQLTENIFTIDGVTDIEEVSEKLGRTLPEGDYDTLGGMIISHLGYIPGENETPSLEINHTLFTVLSVEDRRIDKVRVEKLPIPETDEETDEE